MKFKLFEECLFLCNFTSYAGSTNSFIAKFHNIWSPSIGKNFTNVLLIENIFKKKKLKTMSRPLKLQRFKTCIVAAKT